MLDLKKYTGKTHRLEIDKEFICLREIPYSDMERIMNIENDMKQTRELVKASVCDEQGKAVGLKDEDVGNIPMSVYKDIVSKCMEINKGDEKKS